MEYNILSKYVQNNIHLIPMGVDMEKFKPIREIDKKKRLRKKYGIPLESYSLLHIGHLKIDRNIEFLRTLQNKDTQVIFAISTSTRKHDANQDQIKEDLISSGMILIDKYIENIEELYQLSDCYIFPVENPMAAISLPLSILEANACRIPVVTTPFQGIIQLGNQKGYNLPEYGIWLTELSDFSKKIKSIRSLNGAIKIKPINIQWSDIISYIL
jgi:glycosyltransferase involved in cell wall biosynthesis